MSKATRIVAAVMLIGVLAALLPACGAGPTPTIPPPYQAQPSFTPEPTAPPEPTAVPPTPTPEPPTAVPGNTTGVTDTTIKLGSFAALSGPVAPIGIPCSHGYLAYYQWVNDQGGINGRKIDITVEDDAFDPSKTVAATKKLVEQDQVFAIVSPLGTPGNMAVMQYLVDNNIPVFCPHSGASAWAFPLKPNYFALQPNYTVEGRTLAQYAVNVLGAEKIALFHVNDDFGNEEANAFKSELAKMGKGTIVAEVAHEGTDTDFSSYAIKLQEANPDLVVLSSYLAGAAGVLKESELLAFKPMWLASYVISDPVIVTVAGASAMEGYRVFGYAAAPTNRDVPGVPEYQDILHKYYPDEAFGGYSEIGFAAAQFVVQALRDAGPDLTREKFIDALNNLKGFSTGLLPPVSYSPTDHSGVRSFVVFKFENGTWTLETPLVTLQD